MLLTLLANLVMVGGAAPPTPEPEVAVKPSGGFGLGHYERRSRDEIKRARKRFGITEKEETVIERVVARQVEQLGKDEAERKEEVAVQLEIEGIQARAKHYKMAAFLYQQMIDAEIGRRLKELQDEEEETILRAVLSVME